jgi:hypothetical protein
MEGTRTREQSAEMLKLNANDPASRTHIIREWAHSQIDVLANGNHCAHIICE